MQTVLNAVWKAGNGNVYEVVCKLSNAGSDVRCRVCGQGFLVYWARFSRAEQAETKRAVQEELRRHHLFEMAGEEAHAVHPRESFTVMDVVEVVETGMEMLETSAAEEYAAVG